VKQKGFTLDAVDYTILLKTCVTPAFLGLGNDITTHLGTHLKQNRIDVILKTAIVNMYLKCGKPDIALSYWDDTNPPDRVMYVCFLMACTESKR
jgi:hypothetical protein